MNTAIAITAIICTALIANAIIAAVRDVAKAKATPPYPRDDGDVTALGPEIFASKDGQTISWKGDNYERQQERP